MIDRWFCVSCSATLRNGLNNFRINYISDYSFERFKAEDALTKYLVPYVYAKDLDKHVEKFLEKYCPQALVLICNRVTYNANLLLRLLIDFVFIIH